MKPTEAFGAKPARVTAAKTQSRKDCIEGFRKDFAKSLKPVQVREIKALRDTGR